MKRTNWADQEYEDEGDPTYLDPMRELLGQETLDLISTARWKLITEEDFNKLLDAYTINMLR